jgi:transposase
LILNEIKGRSESRKIKKAITQILALDSTECRIHGGLTCYGSWKKHRGVSNASAKLHVVWDVNGEWIQDFRVTGVRRNDLTLAKTLPLCKNKVYVFDRAYVDLEFWLSIMNAGSDFVTRLKKAPRKEAVHKSVLKPEDLKKSGVLWEGKWTPSDSACQRYKIKPKTLKLRHIIYRDEASGRIFDFITSNFLLDAQEIAKIYKLRWSVELLFKWLKSHLDIRYLALRTKNAVKTQLAIAVLTQLLLRLKSVTEKSKNTLWHLLRAIRTQLIAKSLTEYGVPDGCRWKSNTVLNSEMLIKLK